MENLDLTDSPSSRKPVNNIARYWCCEVLGELDFLSGRFNSQRYSQHWHEGPTIGVITRGTKRFSCRGQTHELSTGSWMLINPDEVHKGEAVDSNGWSQRLIYPAIDWILRLCDELEVHAPRVIAPRFARATAFDAETSDRFVQAHRAAELMHYEGTISQIEAEASMLYAMQSVLSRYLLSKANTDNTPHPADTTFDRLQPALDLIDSNLAADLSLDALAGSIGVGRFHFLRMFRAAVGVAPHAYVLHSRVARAKQLLDGGMSASAAALDVGFFDQSHFSNAFRNAYGTTPTSYLARHRGFSTD